MDSKSNPNPRLAGFARSYDGTFAAAEFLERLDDVGTRSWPWELPCLSENSSQRVLIYHYPAIQAAGLQRPQKVLVSPTS